MIKEFVQAWDKNNQELLKSFQDKNPEGYQEIVEKLVEIVINPYITDNDNIPDYRMQRGLDLPKMIVIDNGDYQGTTIYIIPYDTYQPDVEDYVLTDNYYGSCGGCDTFQSIADNYYSYCDDTEDERKEKTQRAGKEYHTLALHLLQSFKFLGGRDENTLDN